MAQNASRYYLIAKLSDIIKQDSTLPNRSFKGPLKSCAANDLIV